MHDNMIDEPWPTAWAETIERYRESCTRAGMPALAHGARTHLRALAMSATAPPHAVTGEMVAAHLSADDVPLSERRRRLTDVRAFYRWMVEAGHIEADPTAGLHAPDVIAAHRSARTPAP